MSDAMNPEDVFARLEKIEDISGCPLIISEDGGSIIIMSLYVVIFLKHDRESRKSFVGVSSNDNGVNILIGFGVQPKMVPLDYDRAEAMVTRLIRQKERTEAEFMNFKADQEIFKLEVWHSLGGAVTKPIRNSAGWLSDFVIENPDKVTPEIMIRINRISAIMDHVLDDMRKDRKRKSAVYL